jgi:preprotein translocase subunit SecE
MKVSKIRRFSAQPPQLPLAGLFIDRGHSIWYTKVINALGAFFRIRPSTMDILKYLKETKAELKEVTFPSTSQTITYTVLVVVISLFVAIMLGGIDLGLKEGLTRLLSR